MKILSIIVPCYNSQAYMRRCVDSLLAGGDDVEIIIVNDGSTDGTAALADEYRRRIPQMVKVIHQHNKGHGGAINTGLCEAQGVFVKVVDSDDWVNLSAYKKTLKILTSFAPNERPDAFISNYVYEKAGKHRKTAIGYGNVFPQGCLFTWEDIGGFRIGQYLLMHALIYRRDVLQKCDLRLPENTFYVDNIYAYAPLRCVETMYYLNENLYRYFIGREGQSIQEKTMIRRIDQQLAVNRMMVEAIDLRDTDSDKKRAYLAHYMEIVTAVSSILLLIEGSRGSIVKKDALWRFIKDKDAVLYDRLRTGFLGRLLHIPSRPGRYTAILVYKVLRKIVGFN